MKERTDLELVKHCLAGDAAAFGVLVERHQRRLHGVLHALLPDAFERDDVVQETWLEAYLSLDRLRTPARFGAWVCGIGINLAKMRLRRRRQHVGLETAVLVPDHALSVEKLTEKRLREERLFSAIADLPKAEREALLLVYQEGFSQRETAERLGISLSAVKVRVHRGRKRLRAAAGQKEQQKMIEVMIEDLLGNQVDEKAEQGQAVDVEQPPTWHQANIVILKEKHGQRRLPIWIGPFEGAALQIELATIAMERPIVFDLTHTLMGLGELALEKTAVVRLHEEIFYGALTIRKQGKLHEVDCRPSDAINLAVRQQTPIFVAREVMTEASQAPDADGTFRFRSKHPAHHDGLVWVSLLTETVETQMVGREEASRSET